MKIKVSVVLLFVLSFFHGQEAAEDTLKNTERNSIKKNCFSEENIELYNFKRIPYIIKRAVLNAKGNFVNGTDSDIIIFTDTE